MPRFVSDLRLWLEAQTKKWFSYNKTCIILALKYMSTNHEKSLQESALTGVTSIILLQYVFFRFKIKQKDLIIEKCKKSKTSVAYSIFFCDLWPTVSILTSDPVDFLSRGCKNNLSDACDIDWISKALEFHFLYIYVCYVCYSMCEKIVK